MSYISSMPILASSERPNRSCEMHLRTDHTWAKCVLKRIGKPQTRRHFRHLADDKGNHVVHERGGSQCLDAPTF